MQTDKTTLQDLSVFGPGGGVFGLLDRTTTQAGRDALRRLVISPPATLAALQGLQDAVRWWVSHPDAWTDKISNGTLVMLERFYEAADSVTAPPAGLLGMLTPALQKLFNRNEYSFVRFSVTQLADFLTGCSELAALRNDSTMPPVLQAELKGVEEALNVPLVAELQKVGGATPYNELARLSFRARRELKTASQRLVAHYARLDAWRSLAKATIEHHWAFPTLLPERPVELNAEGLYHPLLQHPVPYDMSFRDGRSFLLLTGANMSGKTTMLRSLGVATLMAHLGCGVPARSMSISFLHGIVTNMHVEDNLLKGESYFFAEVQRMKGTAQRLQGDAPHLVLMDELFKGTNVHDAYECTRAVVDGLLNRPAHLLVLSTHLHEVALHFTGNPALQFAYFITDMSEDGSFRFTYRLSPGVSTDRIGYRILQQEGVIDLLKHK
jgi:DNA mismatch repair ATPase MutS